MGRGVAYSHAYKMLIDDDECFVETIDGEPEFGEHSYNDWLDEVASHFKAWRSNRRLRDIGPDAEMFAESERVILGIDRAGAIPCLFVLPKSYLVSQYSLNEREYKIDREVGKAFNKMIRERPGMYKYPTSAWATRVLASYDPLTYVESE